MISQDKLLAMLTMQDRLNQKIHPQWRSQNFKWTRAIMVEAVEALEHYGWKWWKKQEPDLAQVRIELVDIWHFILSHELEAGTTSEQIGVAVENGAPLYLIEGDTRKTFELLIASAAVGQIHLNAFMALMHQVGLTWDELYAIYVAKNVLNMFRQDHGYKAGTYIKMWDGVEDNVALDTLMKLKPDATPDQLYAKLEEVYFKVQMEALGAVRWRRMTALLTSSL